MCFLWCLVAFVVGAVVGVVVMAVVRAGGEADVWMEGYEAGARDAARADRQVDDMESGR